MVKERSWGKNVTYLRDWRSVNEMYIQRATFYLDFDWVKSWDKELVEMNRGKKGAPYRFPDSLIELQGVWLNFFSYRGAEGLTRQLVDLGHLPDFNDYSTIQRRVTSLSLKIPKPKKKEFSAVCDGTGVKMNMSGEYFEQKYGDGKKKKFIKVVATADPFDKDLLNVEVFIEGKGDSEPTIAEMHMQELIKEGYAITQFYGDGSFDKHKLFDFCDQHGIDPVIKIRDSANPKSEGSWKRSVEVKSYQELGYERWAEKKHYGRRWVGSEGVFSSVKKIFGERVRAHDENNMCKEAYRKFWAYQVIKRYAEEKMEIMS